MPLVTWLLIDGVRQKPINQVNKIAVLVNRFRDVTIIVGYLLSSFGSSTEHYNAKNTFLTSA